MNGISPKLPLLVDKQDGPYGLNKRLNQSIKQNFKNLILTSPGERVMIPEFGVGLKRNDALYLKIRMYKLQINSLTTHNTMSWHWPN